jgi:light-regulated signal transduction histidine kinase (bacteriophytochrome)
MSHLRLTCHFALNMHPVPSVPVIDLSACAREQIRTPGSIQPHGFLLTLSEELMVLQASANLDDWTGRPAAAAVGCLLAEVIGEAAALRLAPELAAPLGPRPYYLGTVGTPNGRNFDVLGHQWDGVAILEFEAVERAQPAGFRQLYPLIGNFLQKVNDAGSAESIAALACQHIRAVTGFGRVMVYRFDADGHGHVTAESKDDAYHSYMGQHFPASDIPVQARELYALSRIRLIQDANYTPAPLVPSINPLTGKPNDLSFAALRSVSPVHLQYMRNMQTMASMSVSLMVKGRLWGLISCHNTEPAPVPFEKRTACEQLGQVLALCIESREDAHELQFRLEVRRIMVSMLAGLTQGSNFIENLSSVFPELLRFARAAGVAVVIDDRVLSFGDTPAESDIQALVDWLAVHDHGDVYHTDKLSDAWPEAASIMRNASGLLAMPISRIHKHYLLWFRPEIVRTIEWAGNPHEKNETVRETAAGGAPPALSPRSSFAAWRETIHGSSLPWHAGEIELALEFRTALLGIALERAEQMAELAEELTRSNKELEAFSYSVSHDLRAPLRHIVGFADLLIEASGSEDGQQRMRFLRNIKDAARLAGKLVDDLLSFSQMGRASLHPTRVDMNGLVAACIDKLALEARGRNIEWDIAPLPAVHADPAFLHLALYNLLANAVKFTGKQDPAVIRMRAEDHPAETVFHVADNGAGFNMDYVHKLFGVFQRLHRMEDFEGTGIGLANVRRIVERHDGRVWATSVQGEGATFSFAIPKHIPNN